MAANEILQETRKLYEASDSHGTRRANSLCKEKLPMKRKSRIEIDREIIASVKLEMERPRLTASVRDALEAEAELAAQTLAGRSASECAPFQNRENPDS
jgi:vacuolar-type H+-ATPase subunit E/Vma4